MADAQTAKTVRGVNIAILVLSILCMLACAAAIAVTGVSGAYLGVHSEEIADALAEEIDITDIKINNADSEDIQALAEALDDAGEDGFKALVDALDKAADGDLTALGGIATNVESLTQIVHTFANLDDEAVKDLSVQLGTSYEELHDFVMDCKSIDDADLQKIAEFFEEHNAVEVAGVVIGVSLLTFMMLFVFVALGALIGLISSILAIRNANEPTKLGGAFVLAIIGAVLAFVCGRLVSGILLIISAVYVNKARKVAVFIPRGQK